MNPNELPATKPHATRWLVWSGVVCLLLAGLCMATSFIVIFAGMRTSFHTLQISPTADIAPQAERDIGLSMIPLFAVFPLGIIGILLLIMGLLWRRPVAKQGK